MKYKKGLKFIDYWNCKWVKRHKEKNTCRKMNKIESRNYKMSLDKLFKPTGISFFDYE